MAIGDTTSPVSWANPPRAAALFNASTAFADSEPKLIADTFSNAIAYGRVQPGPPIRTVGRSNGGSSGRGECTRYS